MNIRITKKGPRNVLSCRRADGTCDTADLGPNLPHHDLAHFVVERQLRLADGFFGRIAQGYSVAQLSDRNVIRNSPPESLLAEIAARALQSLASGACTDMEFAQLMDAELSRWSIPFIQMPRRDIQRMRVEFETLAERFVALQSGEFLELHFPEFATCSGTEPRL